MAKKKRSKSKSKPKQSTVKADAKDITVIEVAKANKAGKDTDFSKLKKWNLGLAIIFVVQAVAILILSKSINLPVVEHYLAPDTLASQGAGHTVMAMAVHHMFDVNLAYLIAAFLLIPAIAQALAATRWRKHYETDLQNGTNCLRWAEYALGGGLVVVVLGLITGVYEVSLLVTIFSLIALGAILSYVLELSRGKIQLSGWISYVFILFTVLVPSLAIGSYIKNAVVYGVGLPHYVYWADALIFALFMATAIVFYSSGHKKGRLADTVNAERAYLLLSLVGKTAVAWLIFAGTLR